MTVALLEIYLLEYPGDLLHSILDYIDNINYTY